MTRFQARLEAMRVAARELVESFATDAWESLKESQLTNPLNKFGGFHSEVTAAGDSECADVSMEWLTGLAAGKKFLRGHREYTKAHGRQDKFMDFADALKDFYSFLLKIDIAPCPSFKLLWLRALFHEAADNSKSMRAGLAAAFDEGLADTMRQAERDSTTSSSGSRVRFSGDAWLRAVLHKGFIECLQHVDGKGLAEGLPPLVSDCRSSLELLSNMPTFKAQCEVAIDDFFAVTTVLEAALDPSPARPGDVAQSLKLLDSKRLALFQKSLVQTSLGKSVVTTAANVMQISEKDSVGDDALARAIAILDDKRLPNLRMCEAGSGKADAIIKGFHLILDMSIAGILDESLGCAAEALSLWTPGRIAEMDDKVREWAQMMMCNILFVDESLCLYLDALALSASVARLLGITADGEEDFIVDGIFSKSSLAELSSTLDSQSIDEAAFLKLAKNVRDFFDTDRSLREDTKCLFADMVARIDARILANIDSRTNLISLICALADFEELPRAPADALTDWKGKLAASRTDSSFLSNAIRLQHLMNKVQPFYLNEDDAANWSWNFAIEMDDADPSKNLEASYEAAAALVQNILGAPLIVAIAKLLRDVVQLMADELGDNLILSAVRMPSPEILAAPAKTANHIAELLESFYDKQLSAEPLKVAQRVFAHNSTKEASWPSVQALDMFRELLAVAPAESFAVVLENFVHIGSPVPSWTDKQSLLRLMEVLTPMAQVTAALIFVRSRIVGEEGIARDYQLKEEVEHAISFAKNTAGKLVEVLASRPLVEEVRKIQWRSDAVVHCKSWFQAVLQALPSIAKYTLTKVLALARELTVSVHSFTPKTDHIVSADKFAVSLARKSLLNWPSRQQLNDRTVQLFHSLTSLSRLHTHWGLPGNIRDDEDLKEDLDEAYGIFESARAAITLIAAVNILTELRGEEQRVKAAELLAKKKDMLAKSLVAELEKLTK